LRESMKFSARSILAIGQMFAALRAQTEEGRASLRACIGAPSRAERKDDEPPKLN
jgi:hypothetical protein